MRLPYWYALDVDNRQGNSVMGRSIFSNKLLVSGGKIMDL